MSNTLKVFMLETRSIGRRVDLFAVKAKTEHGESVLSAPTLEALEAFVQASIGKEVSLDTRDIE